MKCTACGGALEDGFLPDMGHAQVWAAVWVAGHPSTKMSFWERFRSGGGVSLEDVEARTIDAKRCTACGHLELYATRPPEPGTHTAGT